MFFRRLEILALGAVLLLWQSSMAWSRTITVDDDGPADFQRVQDAVDAAVYGDEVVIFPGIYSDVRTRVLTLRFPPGWLGGSTVEAEVTALVFLKDGVKLRGLAREEVVLDAQGRGTVVFGTEVGPATSVEEVTIQGGISNQYEHPFLGRMGGGIMLFNAAPVISRNIIRANTAVEFGGGIEVAFSYGIARLERNEVTNNSVSVGGGGIDIVNSDPIVEGNLIVGNRAGAGSGGGIAVYDLFGVEFKPGLVMNTVARNEAAGGGGIALVDGGLVGWPTQVMGNIVYANIASGNKRGGGILISDAVAGISFNNVFSNEGGNYAGGKDRDLTGIGGNISADPLFANPDAGDWRLTRDSPSIDAVPVELFMAGKELFGFATRDLEGNARPLDGDSDSEAVLDMGAFEFNRGSILDLRIKQDRETLVWRAEAGGLLYNIYRGLFEGLQTGLFGTCLGSVDATVAGSEFGDPQEPEAGEGFIYLVTQQTSEGEQSLGFSREGLERVNAAPCP